MIKRPTSKGNKQRVSLQQSISTEDSEDEGGFSKWLQSNASAKLMWYFIICNATVVFLTMTWPKIHEVMSDLIAYIFSE